MVGNKAMQHYGKGACRFGSRGSSGQLDVGIAQDEEQAYAALKAVKGRAKRERAEARGVAKRKPITMPKLKFMAGPFEDD
jgi:hypothetical protein